MLRLQHHILNGVNKLMSSPLVTIDPAALASFASGVESAATSINTSAGTISSAVTVLTPYLQQLVANQSGLDPADQDAVNQALTDLGSSTSTLVDAVSSLAALEPPAPAPAPEPTPDPSTDS